VTVTEKKSLDLSEWQWFWRMLRPYAIPQSVSAGLLLAATFISLTDPLILKWLIDEGIRGHRGSLILWAILLFVAVYGARIVLVAVGTLFSMRTAQGVMLRLRLALVRRLLTLDARFYDAYPVGDLLQRVEQDVELAGEVGKELFPNFMRIIVSVTTAIVIMCVLDPWLTCIILPCLPIFLYFREKFRSRLEGAADCARTRIGERSSLLAECLQGALQVQLLQSEHTVLKKWSGLLVRSARTAVRQSCIEVSYLAIWLAAFAILTAGILGVGAYQVIHGVLTLGSYIAFYGYTMRLFEPLGFAVETYSRLKRAGGSIRRIAQLQAYSSNTEGRAIAQTSVTREVYKLAFHRVHFQYKDNQPLLHDVTFSVAGGEKVALIGPSGSGKSTLAKLVVRLYETDTGMISVNGLDILGVELRELRRMISYVPQQPFLFQGTLRENATLGVGSSQQKHLEQFAELSCFDSVVQKFPSAWNHVLGPNGSGLSDGEKQRLALVRGLLHNRPILILDEITSVLDPILEEELLRRLEDHVRDKAVLIISHRVAAVRWSDKAFLLDKGRIVNAYHPRDLVQLELVATQLWLGSSEDPSERQPVARLFARQADYAE
jgi:ABC-type multidrug transport system fused ATPase/permease subunit